MTDWKVTTLLANPSGGYRRLPVKIDIVPPGGDLTLPVGPALLIIEAVERHTERAKDNGHSHHSGSAG
jgi:hypothetical protein